MSAVAGAEGERMEFGLLLPHFGNEVDAARVLAGAKRAEALGFHSVWVRDHLSAPTVPGSSGSEFLEGLTVLTAVGASTSRIRLGTAALVPLRHPLHTAAIAAAATHLVGPRLVFGVGGGSSDREFEAVGLGGLSRLDLLLQNVAIMRRAWSGEPVSWSDDVFRFHDIAIRPKPVGGPIPFWYCGNTPKSVRVAAEHLEGWLPGRIGIETLRVRVQSLREEAKRRNRPMPYVGVMPAISIVPDGGDALAGVDIEPLLHLANVARYWVKPASGAFSSVADLDGMLLWGTPDRVTEQCRALATIGVRHIVFDCRLTFDRWEEQMELLASHVLAELAA